jgi:hypothetical protein
LRAKLESLKVILRALDWHKITLTWNFNRWFLLLGFALYRPDLVATKEWDRRRGAEAWDLSSRLYFLATSRDRHLDVAAVPDLLVVARHGRFGNNVRQILYALVVAERLEISEVVAKSIPEFPRGSWALTPSLRLTHDPLLRPHSAAGPRVVLAGDFFVVPRLPVDIADVDYSTLGAGLSLASGLSPEFALPEDTLVIHLRSGDAFRENPHPALGQPPLSFYRAVVEHVKPGHVVFVYENEANPVISGLKDYLDSQEIAFSVHSGDLRSDLTVLLSAQQLVTANGTFGQSVLALSTHLRTWYHFGNEEERFPSSKSRRAISVRDKTGDYSRAMEHWQNTKAQRELMLAYPDSALEIAEPPA